MSSHAAYDPVHDCYFVVSGFPAVVGQLLDRSGRALGPVITLDSQRAFVVERTVYSPDVSDGAGRRGGFIIVWVPDATSLGTELMAQIVVFPGIPVDGSKRIFTAPSGFITSSDVEYSPSARIFLVAVEYWKGSGSIFDAPSRLLRLNLQAQVLTETALSSDPNDNCFAEGFSSCDVHVKWNSIANEFGVLYAQSFGSQTNFRIARILARVRDDGIVLNRTTLEFGGQAYSALEVNSATGNYLALMNAATAPVYGVEVAPDGTIIAKGRVASDFTVDGHDFSPLRLAYSPASGTFLLAGRTVGAPVPDQLRELNQHGVPLAPTLPANNWWFGLTAHTTSPEWVVAIPGSTSIIGTNSAFGGSNAMLPDCLTPDPFVSLGGGRCVNRGWLPPGHPLIPPGTPPPPPPPPPPPGTCTIPDPFTSLGGGVCVNGGWVPRGHPLAGGGQ